MGEGRIPWVTSANLNNLVDIRTTNIWLVPRLEVVGNLVSQSCRGSLIKDH